MRQLFLTLILIGLASGQTLSPEITLEKQRLLILPATTGTQNESIETAVTSLVSTEATQLKRFIIIDRTNLEALLQEQSIQLSGLIKDEDLVTIGNIAGAPEALLVRITNFGQKGVPPEDEEKKDEDDDDDGLLSWVVKKSVKAIIAKELENVEQYPNNIQTIVQGDVRKINLETGETIASFSLNAEHTGGNKTASLSKVLNRLRSQISRELRELYVLTSEVIDVDGRNVTLLLGSDMGVKPGTYFEVSAPDKKRVIGNRTISIPGRSVGLVITQDVSGDANQSLAVRRWRTIKPGYRAVELTHQPVSGGVSLRVGLDESVFMAGAFVDPFPFGRFSFLGQAGIGSVLDSWETVDFSLRLGGQVLGRLIQTSQFSAGATLGLPLDIVLRSDDGEHTVSLPVFSPTLGLRVEWMLSPHRDLILGLETVLSSVSSTEWKYT
ncbi:MAG: hypothetical protein GXO90_08350, partial [FCB group bacterium]|nr:hypothetical protein [FCB group bacterium]